MFEKGQRVMYIPTHAHGDRDHKDCQCGVVSSKNGAYIFVKYDNAVGQMITGDENFTAQATLRTDLVLV